MRDSIVFLHLSDIHLEHESDISDKHIPKIIDSLKSYKTIKFEHIVIVLSGDITQSGTTAQFSSARKLMGSLIIQLSQQFKCKLTVLVVPGNHDVDHSKNVCRIADLKDQKFSEIEVVESKKLTSFYNFSRFNHCFDNCEIYCDIKTIDINGFKIQVNLVNNAIFSTRDQYKGLLYIPDSQIERLSRKGEANFVITIMHHAPDFYRDEIKNKIEDTIIKNSNILFHGHEHYNYSKHTSFNGSDETIIQSGGCLCDRGNWNESEYIIGILNTQSLEYQYHRYRWNERSEQYEHDEMKTEMIVDANKHLPITEDFCEFLSDDYNEDYFVFPSIVFHGNDPTEDHRIDTCERFIEEIINSHYSILVGNSNIGKTTLLKHLFMTFSKTHFVIYLSPDKLIEKSKSKKQNIEKLIKSLFTDIYGSDQSYWQTFEQTDKENCIFMLDDFDQIEGINLNELFQSLNSRFGTIIISNSQSIDFDPYNITIEDKETTAKFEIKSPVGNKRREIIRAVVRKKASDPSEKNIENIVQQIDVLIKTQLNIIPPEPYYIVQITENYMNNVGEAIYKSVNAFSKVFEANLTNRIDAALQSNNKNITVDLMYVIFSKIAYYIHFNKAYPIKRSEISKVIEEYNSQYGYDFETEDIIIIAKSAKIITDTEQSRESFRFRNKSILAYFVAKEIIRSKDEQALIEIINKSCINICSDILLFFIYLTEDTTILKKILLFIKEVINSDSAWNEFSIPNRIPTFIQNSRQLTIDNSPINAKKEKEKIEKSEEEYEESTVKEFKLKDIYDWDDAVIDKHNNKLIRMTSLLQIVSRCLPCFEHHLLKEEKSQVIECLYTLPNRIFMFWCSYIEEHYDDIFEELKAHPYFSKRKPNLREEDLVNNLKASFARYSMNLLLNLYYIPVLNAARKNTFQFLTNKTFFDYETDETYQIEHLMYLEQMYDSGEFVNTALDMKRHSSDMVFLYLLRCVVRHGLITRNDKRNNIDRLEDTFFPKSKKPLLIERAKDKYSRK